MILLKRRILSLNTFLSTHFNISLTHFVDIAKNVKRIVLPPPSPCGVVKHTPQGRPSPVKGEGIVSCIVPLSHLKDPFSPQRRERMAVGT
jgi:hypothetical protein